MRVPLYHLNGDALQDSASSRVYLQVCKAVGVVFDCNSSGATACLQPHLRDYSSIYQKEVCCRLRHRKHVQECVEALLGYEEVNEQLELASEELRYAAKALGKVTGAIGIEDILDAIFSEFCVGK